MKIIHLILFSLTLALVAAAASNAALDPSYDFTAPVDTVPFYDGGTYDESVPTPNDYLQHRIGEWPLRYNELCEYLEVLGNASDRVKVEVFGSTYENRDMYAVYISSPENIRQLDDLRVRMDRVAKPGAFAIEADLDAAVADLPAFAWLGYSIHGDEISGVDAACQLIYQLAAGTDEATLNLLENVVVIVNPSENPDGRERYLSMLQTYKSAVPNYNRFSMQHQGVWPWGRSNHYWFDMNRDCILMRQKETRARLPVITKWHPVLCVDGHEMGSNATFLMSPPREPVNRNTPDIYFKWSKIFAQDQAAAFDERGWPYYTGEWNDQWYIGYSSAWPTFFGAIGILYEMAGVDGQVVKQQDDYLLTYHEAVNKQFTSSLANLTTVAKNRVELLKDYYHARTKIADDGAKSRLTYLIKPSTDEIKMQRFVESMVLQGIDVTRATTSFSVAATDYTGKKYNSVTFPEGTVIVSTAQAHGKLAKAALEFDPRLSNEFLEEERRELEKFGETRMYETSAWTPLMAYGFDAYRTTTAFSVDQESISSYPLSSGTLHNPNAQFGFVIDMVGEKTNRMLVELFAHELVVRASEKEFTIEGRKYKRGALLLWKRGNPENLPDVLGALAEKVGLDIYGVNTGMSSEGSLLGAGTYRLLQKPKIALVVGDGMDYGAAGEAWYLLDQELQIPHSLITAGDLSRSNLSIYNTIYLPGSWAPTGSLIGSPHNLMSWVRDGGTLVISGGSVSWAADSSTGLSEVRLYRNVLDKLDKYQVDLKRERRAEAPSIDTIALYHPELYKPTVNEGEASKPLGKEEAEELDRWQRRFAPQGVILKALLDQDSWLTFGLEESVPVFKWGDEVFMAKQPVHTAARLADYGEIRLSGLLWPEARERLANSAFVTQERVGRGQVILVAGRPHFRAYFFGSRQMLVNALLYGPGMGARFEGPSQ